MRKNYTTDTDQTTGIFDGDLEPRKLPQICRTKRLPMGTLIFMGISHVLKTGQPAASRGSLLEIFQPNEKIELAHRIG
jgi:hypothetical protein